ncbi:MAG: hypothetical protein QM802_20725 [Agriterribacter sp.]
MKQFPVSANKPSRMNVVFNRVACWITQKAGSPVVIVGAFLLIVLWGFADQYFISLIPGNSSSIPLLQLSLF